MRTYLIIDYDENNQSSYKRLIIHYDNVDKEETIFFDTGDIIIDYIDYIKWVSKKENIIYEVRSSSWDHFFMDGDEIVPLHIDHNNEDRVIKDFQNINLSTISEYPANKNIHSFNDLKQYYKNHKYG